MSGGYQPTDKKPAPSNPKEPAPTKYDPVKAARREAEVHSRDVQQSSEAEIMAGHRYDCPGCNADIPYEQCGCRELYRAMIPGEIEKFVARKQLERRIAEIDELIMANAGHQFVLTKG